MHIIWQSQPELKQNLEKNRMLSGNFDEKKNVESPYFSFYVTRLLYFLLTCFDKHCVKMSPLSFCRVLKILLVMINKR